MSQYPIILLIDITEQFDGMLQRKYAVHLLSLEKKYINKNLKQQQSVSVIQYD